MHFCLSFIGYKMRQGMGCGGADKWSLQPNSAFPNMYWGGGSGALIGPLHGGLPYMLMNATFASVLPST